ncbi:MAG: YbbN family protein [Erysipelotrichaceae bacterium]
MSHRVQMTNPVNQLHLFKSTQKPFVMLFQTETCGVSYVAVDAIKYPEIAGQHQVFTVPTILVWSENHEILRESRFINFSKIERLLEFVQVYETDYESLNQTNN